MEPTNPTLLSIHSTIRYVVLAMLLVLIVKSLMGWLNKSSYTPGDNRISLFTLIITHVQFTVGLILSFFSAFVPENMKWTGEHLLLMIIAVVLITVARSTSKKIVDGPSRHKRLFIFNTIALVIILAGVWMTGRGFFG